MTISTQKSKLFSEYGECRVDSQRTYQFPISILCFLRRFGISTTKTTRLSHIWKPLLSAFAARVEYFQIKFFCGSAPAYRKTLNLYLFVNFNTSAIATKHRETSKKPSCSGWKIIRECLCSFGSDKAHLIDTCWGKLFR